MSPELLRDRAFLLKEARSFFAHRGVLEVDCCALIRAPSLDAHVEVMCASVSDKEQGFLHTSPEYAMKRLLAMGSGDIYYLGHVFRKGEVGRLHNPEFAMAEWYRLHLPFSEFMQEVSMFLFLFFDPLPTRTLSYRDAFLEFAGIDPFRASLSALREAAGHKEWERETLLQFLLTERIEPHLGRGELTLLTDYPPHEAALSRIVEKKGERVAERFEIYYEGVELANGYHELSNAAELRLRFERENENRIAQGKKPYPLDEALLAALEKGLPPCCGVSVGFDRAFMLRNKKGAIREVLSFAWCEPMNLSE